MLGGALRLVWPTSTVHKDAHDLQREQVLSAVRRLPSLADLHRPGEGAIAVVGVEMRVGLSHGPSQPVLTNTVAVLRTGMPPYPHSLQQSPEAATPSATDGVARNNETYSILAPEARLPKRRAGRAGSPGGPEVSVPGLPSRGVAASTRRPLVCSSKAQF